MKEIIRELAEIVRDMRFGTDCGADFLPESCHGCEHYNLCEGTEVHRARCKELLTKIEKL